MASGASQPPQPGTRHEAAPAPEGGDRELRLQMCKKIAQLTKVIYALNTKNDEQEANIQALKEAHQEEIHHVLAETRETILRYKKKAEEEQELRQRICRLEEALEQHRQWKEETPTRFAAGREQEDKGKPQTESQGAEEKFSLPKEMLHVKRCSESRVQPSNQESCGLLSQRGSSDEDVLNIKGNETGSVDIRALISETESLKRENRKLAEEHATKASQLQAARERDEVTWRQAMQQAMADSCQEWQPRDGEQRRHLEAREAASQQRVRQLEADLEAKGQCIEELKKHSQKVHETMQDLELQLKEAQRVIMESKRTVKAQEEELAITKERLLMQENEILQKTEAMQSALNSQSKARGEAGDQKDQLLDHRPELSSKHSPRGKDSQPRGSRSGPKETLKQRRKEDLRKTKPESEAEKMLLKEKLVNGVEDRVKKQALELKAAQTAMEVDRKKVQQPQDGSVQPKAVSKQHKDRTKCREPSSVKSGERRRSDTGGAPKKEDEQNLASFQKEKAKEIQALREEWAFQKAGLQAQVAHLKRILEQQASSFQEALRERSQQSGEEKEKLLQKLQDTLKESRDIKAQLEASHQTAINLLERSKNQELKDAAEQWKKESNESFSAQQESYRQEVQTLKEKTREALQSEMEKIQQQQSLLIESLRMELSEQRESCITHQREKEALQEELRNAMVLKRQQESNNQDQIQSLKDELVKCQNEICGLKRDNSLLKDTVDLLRAEAALPKPTAAPLREPEGQHRRYQELEETPEKREPRPEDLHLISCLQEKLSEKEEMIKELMDGRKLQPSFMSSAEPRRNRSFSFNTNPSTCLAPMAKQKKKMDDAPSRIVSVPNLASYAKSFLSGDLRPKRNLPQITKSASLDPNPGCVRVCSLPVPALETKPGPRLQGNETAKLKDAQKQDPRPQEWFTKYFSF